MLRIAAGCSARSAGQTGHYWSAPNPPVGCVLVRDDREIGAGYTTRRAGCAEVMALNALVMLPVPRPTCTRTLRHHGQTGPCANALIDAGVSRVVVAVEGRSMLLAVGSPRSCCRHEVEQGEGADQVEADLLVFCAMRRGYGRITLKIAMSLDGRTAMPSGRVSGSRVRTRERCSVFGRRLT